MSLGVFIQVRLGSTRLPGKALLELAGATVIQHVMRSVGAVHADVNALLTDAASEAALQSPASAEGFQVMVGPDEDVLARYAMAARAWSVNEIIRVTGDNPLTSASLALEILHQHRAARVDLSHYLGIPWGTGVEVIQAEALFTAEHAARLPEEREHITTYLYRHPEQFHILEAPAPARASLSEGRATVDTPEDLARVRRLFADLYEGRPIEIERAIPWLKAHPHQGAAHA